MLAARASAGGSGEGLGTGGGGVAINLMRGSVGASEAMDTLSMDIVSTDKFSRLVCGDLCKRWWKC